jgi:glycine dehydrogenase subunit 1
MGAGHRYLPNTAADRRQMLEALGLESVEELFADIPDRVRFKGKLELPAPMSELELVRHMAALAGRNATVEEYVTFRGAGAYDHFIPSVVSHITGRAEFYTAYTPYQPEVSQAVLQAIYEYQTLICELTGMEVANASMYDGATAAAEAAIISSQTLTGRRRVVVSSALHPE